MRNFARIKLGYYRLPASQREPATGGAPPPTDQRQEANLTAIPSDPQTLSEMFLVLLEDRFPWLGTDDSAEGADMVEELHELHQTCRKCAGCRLSLRHGFF
jgi:hypothetical protein